MTVQESREAIPPAYTEFIGEQLLAHLDIRSFDPIIEAAELDVIG